MHDFIQPHWHNARRRPPKTKRLAHTKVGSGLLEAHYGSCGFPLSPCRWSILGKASGGFQKTADLLQWGTTAVSGWLPVPKWSIKVQGETGCYCASLGIFKDVGMALLDHIVMVSKWLDQQDRPGSSHLTLDRTWKHHKRKALCRHWRIIRASLRLLPRRSPIDQGNRFSQRKRHTRRCWDQAHRVNWITDLFF